MGILHTITSYLYPNQQKQISQAAIRTKSQRLILKIKNIQYKLQQQTFKQEEQLVKLILHGQVMRMNMIIQKSQKMLVYDEAIYCLNQIISQAGILEHNPSYISNQCVVAISSIIYIYEPLNLKDLINLNEFIPEPHPKIDIKKISQLLQKYLNKKQISDYERNLYIIEMIKRKNLSLQLINKINHKFIQNPVEPIYQSPSSHAFAVTLEEYQVNQQ